MDRYKKQNSEIQKVLKSISKKSKIFADTNHDSKWYDDLLHVLGELKEIEKFL